MREILPVSSVSVEWNQAVNRSIVVLLRRRLPCSFSCPVHFAAPVLALQLSGIGAAAVGALTLLAVDAIVTLLFMPLGHITATWQGAVSLALIGLLGGFMQVAVFTWIQRRVPPHMLGRAMSLLMFIFMGLAPLSSAATAWLMRSVSVGQLFFACGPALLVCVVIALLLTPMRTVKHAEA